jgi:hypothetical protein
MTNLTGPSQLDSGGIPTGSLKVPGVTALKAIQGGALFTDSLGDDSAPIRTEIAASSKITYAAAAVDLALPATPTYVCTLTGSATKVVKLVRIGVSIHCTALGVSAFNVRLIKLSSALTGGVAVAMTMVPMDTAIGSMSATALANNWTTLATGGGAVVGDLMVAKVMPLFVGAQTATDFPTQQMPQIVWDFNGPGGPPTLHGVAQVLAISFGGATLVATTTFSPFMIFTEE